MFILKGILLRNVCVTEFIFCPLIPKMSMITFTVSEVFNFTFTKSLYGLGYIEISLAREFSWIPNIGSILKSMIPEPHDPKRTTLVS